MMDAVAAELLKTGILGAVALVFIYACWKLWDDGKESAKRCEDQAREVAKRHEEQLKAIHDQRVADQQAMTAVILRTTTECVTILTTVANGMEAQRDAMNELKNSFNDDARRRGR